MKRLCMDCKAVEACRHTFGDFWKVKSNQGRGCYAPLDERRARTIMAALYNLTTQRDTK